MPADIAATHHHRWTKAGGAQGRTLLRRAWILLLTGAVVVLAYRNWEQAREAISTSGPRLLLFALLVMVVDMLPVKVDGLRLTLDFPLLLSLALVEPPVAAMIVAFIATIDVREIRHQGMEFWNALFNRAQVAVSVFAAGSVFRLLSPDIEALPVATAGVAIALLVDYVVNTTMVSIHLFLRDSKGLLRTLRKLWVRSPAVFFWTYAGYGLLALVLARLTRDVGLWSVVAFLIPLVAARQMLLNSYRLTDLARTLETQRGQLERLLDQIVEERRDERRSIAGDLHDDVLQAVIEASMLGKLVERQLAGSSPLRGDITELVQATERGIDSLRVLIRDLRRSPLGSRGLKHALEGLKRELGPGSGIHIELTMPPVVSLSDESQVVAYQIAREALTNAMKHARATRVRVGLSSSEYAFALEVSDDGVGFDPRAVDPSKNFGLELTRERAARVGAQVSITSEKGKGTSLKVDFPCKSSKLP